MEFVIEAVIIIAAVAIAIWAATSHQGGAGAAPDASASATSPSRRDADGKVVSRTSSRDGDTGIGHHRGHAEGRHDDGDPHDAGRQ